MLSQHKIHPVSIHILLMENVCCQFGDRLLDTHGESHSLHVQFAGYCTSMSAQVTLLPSFRGQL